MQRAVVSAARKMNLSPEQLSIIKNAFDQVEIEGVSGTISGKITDHDTGALISSADIRALQQVPVPFMFDSTATDITDEYSISLLHGYKGYWLCAIYCSANS